MFLDFRHRLANDPLCPIRRKRAEQTIDCHSNHSVFLRADGSLACWDDAGSRLTLKAFEPAVDYSKDVVFGEVFAGIRRKLFKGDMPFPGFCQDCMVHASGACFNPLWAEKKELLIFQVEPSIACPLECPGCMTLAERKTRHGPPWNLDVAILENYLSDFRADGVLIRTIDFQGHGEPLLNRDVWKMASLAKSYFPDATISMCTNAHGIYHPAQVHSGIDEVMFAIDGVDQQSFEKNRVRGKFDKAYAFMKAFCHGAAREGRDIKTIWKYILFDSNDSPDQLVKAQELAAEAGVRELLFVNTQLGLRASGVYTLDQIPRAGNGVAIRISNYLSSFHDTLHAVDKARYALWLGDAAAAGSHLLFATNMIRRRFECLGPDDALPEAYQALIYEIRDLAKRASIDPATMAMIGGGIHALEDRLVMGILPAKDLIIKWKSEEICRLTGQLDRLPKRSLPAIGRTVIEGGIRALEDKFALDSFSAKNLIIRWKSEEILRLAIQLDQQPGPEVSVM